MKNQHDEINWAERFQRTKHVRKLLHELPVQGKDQTICPYCGGIVDIERPTETHWTAVCRQDDYADYIWV